MKKDIKHTNRKRIDNSRTRKLKHKKKMYRRRRLSALVVAIILIVGVKNIFFKEKKEQTTAASTTVKEPEVKEENKSLIFTVAGDTTLGVDPKFNYNDTIVNVIKSHNDNYGYIMRNVKDIFDKDDYTLLNFESTLTDSKETFNKGHAVQYNFKGPKEFAKVLSKSSIEGVTIANNHINDYGKKGIEDTVSALKNEKIDISGEGYKILKSVNDVNIGILGYQAWSDTEDLRNKVKADIDSLKDQGADMVLVYYHWGTEKANKPSQYQIDLAHYTIDNGADVVLGSHPHVIQGLERYKDKLIAYSLANFSFGGNRNPSDKDTFLLQIKANFKGDEYSGMEFKVIPLLISSVKDRNDYTPTVATGEDKTRILNKINQLSTNLNGKISEEFQSVN